MPIRNHILSCLTDVAGASSSSSYASRAPGGPSYLWFGGSTDNLPEMCVYEVLLSCGPRPDSTLTMWLKMSIKFMNTMANLHNKLSRL